MKVFLYAYDRQNLGDDLFVHTIAKRYPNVKFYLWSKKFNRETFKSIKNLKVIDEESKFGELLKKLHPSLFARYKARLETRCDAVVYIGGSIFIEYKNWEQILTWWDYEAKNRNFYVLGANFGPYKTEAYRDKLAEIFANTKDVCFRDVYSKNKFKEVDTVRCAPDILFGANMPDQSVDEKRVFISLIDCASRDGGLDALSSKEENYIRFLKKQIESFVKLDYKIVLSSFCKTEKDEEAIFKIKNELDTSILESVSEFLYTGTNLDEILQEMANSSVVIASRFHAAILGFVAGKPVLPLVYSDKTIHVLEDVGFTGKVFDIRNLEEAQDFSVDLDNQRLNNIDDIIKQSSQHFIKLDELLKR